MSRKEAVKAKLRKVVSDVACSAGLAAA